MRCKEVQDGIVDGNLSPLAHAHVADCPECQAAARDAEGLHAGLKLLAADAPPEPSWGFAGRVLVRLDEKPARFFEPLEVIGRRAVLAAGVLATTLLMLAAFSTGGTTGGDARGSFSLTRNGASETAEVLLAGGVDEYEELNVLPDIVNGGDQR